MMPNLFVSNCKSVGEELYNIYMYISVYFSTMPIMRNDKLLKKISARNVLTSGIVATYPFLQNELCDENGVVVGCNRFNNSLVMVDRFNSKEYKNPNMCVIGTSGSGKSYFVKLMINRNRYLNINQYIIDPDREYTKLCEKLGGTLIKFGGLETINVMEIRETIKENGESYLQDKISNLNAFFSIIFKEMSLEDKAILEEKIIECYALKGITFENSSLYEEEFSGKVLSKHRFKKPTDMPILEDLYNIIKKDKKLSKFSARLKTYVSGSMKFLNGYTNVDLNNKLVVADIHDIKEENLYEVMFIITELYWDKIKKEKYNRKIIYLDEAWKLINKNENTADFIFKIFKTIRKYGGAATAITQDVNDFFSLDDGKFGKGILNNSSIKCIFQLEESDIDSLKSAVKLSEEEKYRLINLERGTCIMHAGRNHLLLKVQASDKEHEFINTDIKDLGGN